MPASAHHDGDRACPDAGAQVIDLASRASLRRQHAPVRSVPSPVAGPVDVPAPGPFERESAVHRNPEQVADVVGYFERAMAARGVSLSDPAVAAASEVWAGLLEKIVLGAWKLREGSADDGIAADPGRGIDRAGAQMMMDVLRDVRLAPSDLAAIAAAAREL
jgi:hypothetical protein